MGSILQCRHFFGLSFTRVSSNGIRGSFFFYLWKMILSTITEPMKTPIVATTASIMYIQIIYFHPPLPGRPVSLVCHSLSCTCLHINKSTYKQTVATRRTVSNRHILANMRSLYIYIYNDGASLKKSNEMGTIIQHLSSIYLLNYLPTEHVKKTFLAFINSAK